MPRKQIEPATHFSTVGLEKSAQALPGNLFGRWSLLPPFDMQYGSDGVFIGWFDRVSNIRTVVESQPGEEWIRYVDLHYFENAYSVTTNPKNILYAPDQLDDVDAVNLWTRVYGQECDKACRQFGIEDDGPPRVEWRHTIWNNVDFDTSYEAGIEGAAEVEADHIFMGAAVWESAMSFTDNLMRLTTPEEREGTELEKRFHESTGHPLHVLDYKVAEAYGGEDGLKALVQRAKSRGLDAITWGKFCPGVTGYLTDKGDELGAGLRGIFNTKESRRHPDSGYPFHTCSVNLHALIKDYIKDRIVGVMERTGLKGFLWDSFSNTGWWQVNYSDGTMRPQCQEMGELYAELSNKGYYLQPEAIVSFSNHTSLALHGGNIFEDDLCAFAYNSALALNVVEHTPNGTEKRDLLAEALRGDEPFDTLFQCFAHKRISPIRHPAILEDTERILQERLQAFLQDLIQVYRTIRSKMQKRIVLKEGRGVVWTDGSELT